MANDTNETGGRPVVIGFDGTPAAQLAIREAAAALAPRQAYIVVVWEAGRAFELAEIPTSIAMPSSAAMVDIRSATALDRAAAETARQTADRGVALAAAAGLTATGVAIAEDASVAATLIRVATEHAASVIAVGSRGRSAIAELLVGSTVRDLIRHAPCPVLISRAPA